MDKVQEILDLEQQIKDLKFKLKDKTITVAEHEALVDELSKIQSVFDKICLNYYNEFLLFARKNRELYKNWNIPLLRSVQLDSFKVKKSKNAILVRAFNTWDGGFDPFFVLIPFDFICDREAYLVERTKYVKEHMLKMHKKLHSSLQKQKQEIEKQIEQVFVEIQCFDSYFEKKMEEYRDNLI